jgi:hypothetical protein
MKTAGAVRGVYAAIASLATITFELAGSKDPNHPKTPALRLH